MIEHCIEKCRKTLPKSIQKQVKKIDYNNIENVFRTSFDIYSLIWDFQYIFREHFESFTNDNEILQKIKKVNSFVDEYIEEMISKSQKSFLIISIFLRLMKPRPNFILE